VFTLKGSRPLRPALSKTEPNLANTKLLYATSARIGGGGLDAVAAESLRGVHAAQMDWRALAFELRATDLPAARVRSLTSHPVRAISWVVDSEYYYGAKKHALDRIAAAELARRDVQLFHGWSGESVRSLRECRRRGIPSLIEIPTWHRHKGKDKPVRLTKSERERAAAKGWQKFKNSLLVTRQQMLEEYDLADRILVLSEKAEETFLAAGVPKEKLFRHQRGVDVNRFAPAAQPPEKFVAVFVGALIKRKGVHHLIDVWRKLALKNAELVLAGTVHDEIRALLDNDSSIRVLGYASRVEDVYRQAAAHIFPSECEGSAKCTYEAAACGLPQITTREAGDIVQHELNGLIILPNDPDALAAATLRLYHDRDLCARLGAAGRERVVNRFTWDHFRARLLEAYRSALAR
jgi:glycosyltransferase involved in cell wall biosynthesis